MAGIILATLNARYIHSAFGLRYLLANLDELQTGAQLLEFGVGERPAIISEKILQLRPRIIGFGVYIWNVNEISAVARILKQVAPELIVILGGPEVSYPPDLPAIAEEADYIITGNAETGFRDLCRALVKGERPAERIIQGRSTDLAGLASPYPFYNDNDLRQRVIYVEASRGCPFKCEFCLSALDVTAKPFPLSLFLREMAVLYERGARSFKFIDRTFNLKAEVSVAILEFFLERLSADLHVHFEVIPDYLPEALKNTLSLFPQGVLQFEVGVQSFDPVIQQRISRRQDNEKTKANLRWLRQYTNIHIHADLIAGLPGDTLAGFGDSFDQLIALRPQEIQVGILKRLRGAPINRHTEEYQMRYDPHPPYPILSTRDMSFSDLQRLNRFARYWDLIGNSGRYAETLPMILADRPFQRFMALSDALYALLDSTWQISLKRLYELTYQVMTENLDVPPQQAEAVLRLDYRLSGDNKNCPEFLREKHQPAAKQVKANRRQRQHMGYAAFDGRDS
jgi:radical SAM superfamily enzyme YgiQ (UPF0313 family)